MRTHNTRQSVTNRSRLLILIGFSTLFGCLLYFASQKAPKAAPQTQIRANSRSPSSVHYIGRRPVPTPTPPLKPIGLPSRVPWLSAIYNLRDCLCDRDWESKPGQSVCRCNEDCPPHITPPFLTAAEGQSLCNLIEDTGYSCTLACYGANDERLSWSAHPCNRGSDTCDMLLPSSIEFYKNPPPHLVEIAKGKKKKADPPKQEAKAPKPEPKPEPPGDPEWLVRRRNHYDLRGIECELLNGKPQCFMQLSRSRELCPPHVTPEFLDRADTQHICLAENSNTHYCTAKCQEGNDLVQWSAHEYKWCRENPGSCPPEPTYVPKEGFKLQEWSEELPPATKCQREALEGIFPNIKLSEISVGMLTHEPFSFAATLKSYEKYKFFELFEEFNIFVNSRTQEIDDVVKPYLDKYPNVVRLHGQPENIGINGGIVALTNMATKPFFLFLERDFQLIEPATCVVEQLKAGVDILERGIAHVVRYRHQRKPGQPNWAEKMYYGHEDDALKSHQPNLFCNLHYWYENPEDRWPDLMQVCYSEPKFYCSDSYYCNWTNNPQLWKVDWWNEEYVNRRFKKWTRVDPFENLEPYMNWEPDSWNNEKFIVAQGAGLFKHTDLKNYG